MHPASASPSHAAPHAVLFDLDGTLIDSIGLIVGAMEYAFDDRETRPPVDEWIAAIGTPLDGMLRRWARDEADVAHLLTRYREFQRDRHDEMVTAYPGSVESVHALHAEGFALAIVTSKLEAGARRSLAFLGIEEAFGVVVGIDQTTRHKPLPEPVWYALERLGVARQQALFVGDSVHDIRSGNAAGVATAAALWGPSARATLEAARPTHLLESMHDVVPLARQLRMQAAPIG